MGFGVEVALFFAGYIVVSLTLAARLMIRDTKDVDTAKKGEF